MIKKVKQIWPQIRDSLPNSLTVLRMGMTPFIAYEIWDDKHAEVALILFIIACFTDWYDGYLARKWGKITPTGQYLDPLADKILVTTIFFIFAWKGYFAFWMFWIIVTRDIFVTSLRLYAKLAKKPFGTKPIAKWKTFSQMTAIFLIICWHMGVRSQDPSLALLRFIDFINNYNVIWTLMLVVTLYTLITGLVYFYANRRLLKGLAYRVFLPTNVR